MIQATFDRSRWTISPTAGLLSKLRQAHPWNRVIDPEKNPTAGTLVTTRHHPHVSHTPPGGQSGVRRTRASHVASGKSTGAGHGGALGQARSGRSFALSYVDACPFSIPRLNQPPIHRGIPQLEPFLWCRGRSLAWLLRTAARSGPLGHHVFDERKSLLRILPPPPLLHSLGRLTPS